MTLSVDGPRHSSQKSRPRLSEKQAVSPSLFSEFARVVQFVEGVLSVLNVPRHAVSLRMSKNLLRE